MCRRPEKVEWISARDMNSVWTELREKVSRETGFGKARAAPTAPETYQNVTSREKPPLARMYG